MWDAELLTAELRQSNKNMNTRIRKERVQTNAVNKLILSAVTSMFHRQLCIEQSQDGLNAFENTFTTHHILFPKVSAKWLT